MNSTNSAEVRRRVDDRIHAWGIVVERQVETEGSVLAFGQRGDQSVVLKVIRDRGDEWRSGDILNAFAGNGVVRVLDYLDGAVLLERLRPGNSLASMAIDGTDDQATGILADVMGKMSPRAPVGAVPAIQEWAHGFERHAAGGEDQISEPLLEAAQRVYSRLCASQSAQRLLHGDLHHYNVLLDSTRGWLAIDPKGVVGESEYEVGAALRNPYERPELFTEPSTITRRVDRFARELDLNAERILAWAFAQAVLAAIWAVEDGFVVGPDNAWITLANNIHPMLEGVADA
jgi:streptomycin 6-kinase